MDGDQFEVGFQTRKVRNALQRPLIPVYILLVISYLLSIICFAVAFSRVKALSSQLSKMETELAKKSSSSHELQLFPCGLNTRQWEYFKGKCYFFSIEAIDWHRAKTTCQNEHSKLVVIDSLSEQIFIQTRTRNERFWIGLSEVATEGQWKWEDGSNYEAGFKNWKQGEPNNYREQDEDCGQVWINGEWNDFTCHSNSYYICEKPLPSAASRS